MRPILFLLAILLPGTAVAETCGPRLIVDFAEGSPADRFALLNVSDPGWSVTSVEIDLEPSRGLLIFDITGSGAGVASFQPYGEAGGSAVISSRSDVSDGDSRMQLDFQKFEPGDDFNFTIDLDDRLADGGQTQISGSEIRGSVVRALFRSTDGRIVGKQGEFRDTSRADTGEFEACRVS